MNRIQQYWSEPFESSVASDVQVEAGRFTPSGPGTNQWLFVPLHYEQNYAYPLIVWLHGAQDDERQLKRVMPFISLRNYVAVAPRGTLAIESPAAHEGAAVESSGRRDEPAATASLPAAGGYAWSQTEDHILLAEHRVLDAVAAARRKLNISPSRIFLVGYAGGGTMAFRLALNLPRLFAGAISLGGEFPNGHTPLAQLAEVRRLKLLLASGRDSRRYPPQRVCENLRLLYAAGMSISLRQYPCGDDLTTQMLSDLDRWIMEQIAQPVAAVDSQTQPRAGGAAD